jgi:hypothetical protein
MNLYPEFSWRNHLTSLIKRGSVAGEGWVTVVTSGVLIWCGVCGNCGYFGCLMGW